MQTTMRHRVDELDFLKGIFILLMIAFHLIYVSDMYPYTKRVVYLLVSLTICVAGSLSVDWAMYRLGMGQYFYCKRGI